MGITFSRAGIISIFSITFTCLLILSSCEKEVHINLSSSAPTLVVEGQIENGQPPLLVLTHTIGFFSNVDQSTLQNSFVHGALIKVSDGSDTITLKEYTLDTGSTGNTFSFYTIDTADHSALSFKGQIEHYYRLSIVSDGKTYVATTKIPTPIKIDSLVAKVPPYPPSDEPDRMNLNIYFHDPDTLGNYGRYFTKRNGEPYYAGDIYTDIVTNGAPNNLLIFPGYNIAQPDSTSSHYFHKGDTVSIKWCSIDKGVYDFWNTFAFAERAVGNPFATPINSQSNISNGAIGVWAGYGGTVSTIIIPK